jgi:hypothetical protein
VVDAAHAAAVAPGLVLVDPVADAAENLRHKMACRLKRRLRNRALPVTAIGRSD